MRKMKKLFAILLIPAFLAASATACKPEQVDTAQRVLKQAEFYMDMAEALIKVAEGEYAAKPKVQTALKATRAALLTARQAMKVALSGLEKDQDKLKAAVVGLVVEVFALTKAIKEASAASSSTP